MLQGVNNQSPILPNQYVSILKSCIVRESIHPGKQLHGRLIVAGFPFRSVYLVTKLVNLYCICNAVPYARHLFDKIPQTNIFLWNVLIRGYACHALPESAISLYRRLLDRGRPTPNKFTFPFVLNACASLSEIGVGRSIHERVRETELDADVFVATALVDMYGKCGFVDDARKVFDKMPQTDVVLWNSILAAYARNGHPEECLQMCSEMAAKDFRPTEATLVTAIAASADSAKVKQGRELHGYGWRLGFVLNDRVRTGLIDMYTKGGNVGAARMLFEGSTAKRLVSWNAMIAGYAMHGRAREALDLFKQMVGKVQPNGITFVGVLSACNRGGLLDEGRAHFNAMVRSYGIEPTIQHYTCMVDLLGHSDRLDEAYSLIRKMKAMPDSAIWGALLNSCKIHGNVELGELALERLIELNPNDAGNYVIMSNIYAQAGKWDQVANLRKLMANSKVKKSVGCSWVEVKSKIHAFVSGDTSHPMSDRIYAELSELRELLSKSGYVPNISTVFYNVEDDEKVTQVSSHSERLAIAFALISTPPGSRLLVTKNIRVCEDCHIVIKLISRIKRRAITVRDVNRYHHFKDGSCSCSDNW